MAGAFLLGEEAAVEVACVGVSNEKSLARCRRPDGSLWWMRRRIHQREPSGRRHRARLFSFDTPTHATSTAASSPKRKAPAMPGLLLSNRGTQPPNLKFTPTLSTLTFIFTLIPL